MSTTIKAAEIPSAPCKLTEIKPGFGAEVTGLTFQNGVPDESFHRLEDAVTKACFNLCYYLKLSMPLILASSMAPSLFAVPI